MENNVKRYRQVRGLSLRKLADRISYTPMAISKIERKLVRPLPRTRDLLAEALNVSVAELFPEDERYIAA